MPLAPHTRFGRYVVTSKLGEGGMGEVYLAQDTQLGRPVALKILHAEVASDRKRMQRFTQEAQAASALNHPNILTIYEIGEADSTQFIATEFVDGETLRQNTGNKRMAISESLDIAIQIASALSAAHVAGIVHRDIKPDNIMLRRDRLVKLLDFGLAKLTEQPPQRAEVEMDAPTQTGPVTEAGTVMGTLHYMSPEQARGFETDRRTDIWALGCVLYEIVTGHRSFPGATAADVLASIITTNPLPLSRHAPDAPVKLQEIVDKALEKDREDRYQDVKDLLVDLRRLKKRLEFETELRRHDPEEKTTLQTAGAELVGHEAALLVPPNNLAAQTASMVGRERETKKICDELRSDRVRLLTLTGIGGTGKTTLARSAARQLLHDFPDGDFFVELGAISRADLVASTIAQPLGVKEADGKSILEALKNYLRGKKVLLVIDSFEHLASAASILAELLAVAPGLKMLVTSRALLHLSLEREYMVPPLTAPEASERLSTDDLMRYEAVRLFVDRARGAKPAFVLTEENAASVAAICARLEGLPLAIELAAARVKVLSPQSILSRLDRRLNLLKGGALDLPTRQQTMSGAIDWSYDLLTEEEKQLFRRLAVFAGGFTFDAAEGVFSGRQPITLQKEIADKPAPPMDVLEGVTSLASKSLLVTKQKSLGEVRFRMLDVVREYAHDRLEASGEAEEMRRHHAAYFLAFAEEAEPHLRGADPAKWLNRLEEEHDNLRAALRWSLTHDIATATRIGAAIRYLWDFQGHLTEGLAISKEILSLGDRVPTTVRWKLLSMAGNLARFQGDHETARHMYQQALEGARSADDLPQVSLSCRGLGGLAIEQGDYITARRFIEEALATARESNDKFGVARSLSTLGDLARAVGDDTSPRALYEEALAICRELGKKYAIANILTNLGAAEYGEGNYPAAYSHFTEGLKMARESGDKIIGDKIGISYSLDGLAALAVQRGEAELAARLSGVTEHLRESINYKIEPAERMFRDAYLACLRKMLSEDDFSRAYDQGRKLKLDDGIALALGEKTG